MVRHTYRLGLLAGFAASAIFATAAQAQERTFDIPAQNLSAALKAFGFQSGRAIAFSPDDVKGRSSQGVKGRFQADDALASMLSGSTLTYGRAADGFIVLDRQGGAPRITKAALVTQAPVAASSAAAPPPAVVGLEEIVVTAQRRAEDAQKTPIAIAAISGADLEAQGGSSVGALTALVPGLVVQSGTAYAGISIRGIGSGSSNAYGDQAVSYNVDGVVFSRLTALGGVYYDLDRVEVLKGPQGTLYGKNATSGAINIISKRPSDQFEGGAWVDVGNYRSIDVGGFVNIPLTDTLSSRVSMKSVNHEGYLSSGAGDADAVAGRLQLLYQPTDDLSLLLAGHYYKETGRGPQPISLVNINGQRFLRPSDPWYVGVGPVVYDGTGSQYPADSFQDNRVYGGSVTLDWSLGLGNLTVIAAHLVTDNDFKNYQSGYEVRIVSLSEQDTLEARLASSGDGPLKWVVGGFYLHERQKARQSYLQRAGPFRVNLDRLPVTSYAAFGQGTYSITDKLRATLGVRFTRDEKEQSGQTVTVTGAFPNVGSVSWDSTDYRAGLEYDLLERSMIYATVASGYKAGGFYSGASPNSYEPEELVAYSFGSKNRFFDNRLQLNAEAFYWKYTDFQVSAYALVNPPPFAAFVTQNAKRAHVSGVDLDGVLLVTAADRINLGVQYLKTKYDDFIIRGVSTADNRTPTLTNYSGRSLPQPTWTVNLGYEHTFTLSNEGTIVASARTEYQSGHWLNYTQVAVRQYQKDYMMSDATLTYREPEERWSVSAYVRNIEDEAVLTSAATGQNGTQGSIRPPRTYGVRLDAKF